MENIAMDTCNLIHVLESRHPALCPYHDVETKICTASFSSITVDRKRSSCYCSIDNFDNCALFLAKTLRKQ